MGFWGGFAKGLQEYRGQQFETSEREAQQQFVLSRDEQQREFEREQARIAAQNALRLNREEQLFKMFPGGRGTRGTGSGGSASEVDTSGITYLTNYFGSDESIDEDKLAEFLSGISDNPELASDIMKAIETQRKDLGYDRSAANVFADLEAWIPVVQENPNDEELRAEFMKILTGDVDVLDDETYFGLVDQMSTAGREMQAEPAFRLATPLSPEVADAQFEAFSSQVIRMASAVADGEQADGPEREVYELLLQAQDSDKVAATAAIAELNTRFGPQAVEALKATGNDLFSNIEQNWNIKPLLETPEPVVADPVVEESEAVVPDRTSSSEVEKPARAFASLDALYGALRNQTIEPGQPIIFNGREQEAPTLEQVEAAIEAKRR